MIRAGHPALVLAPMDGITDAPMRALQGASGAFTFAVSEFLRVSVSPLPAKVFRAEVPELPAGARTMTGLPVQVQLLGGDPDRMAQSAIAAVRAGATAIDINFGCPAPTVNRHDGGASLLKFPYRIRDIVGCVRSSVPPEVPVSAKLRLGWDSTDPILENAQMAEEGGASWITIHARTRVQGYAPPVYWPSIGKVREVIGIPVVANGDIWTLEDYFRCRDETGCTHFMLGRGALADPALPLRIARELGLTSAAVPITDWAHTFRRLVEFTDVLEERVSEKSLMRLKQWASIASKFGDFPYFDAVKRSKTLTEFFDSLPAAEWRGPVSVK